MKEKSEYLNVSKSERKLPPPVAFTMLEPILDEWCVKVKVIKKHNEKTWANERGSGRVCAITVEDELSSKRFKVIMFNDLINEFYDKMEEGETYYINKGHLIKKSNDDTYEIQLCANSLVRNIHEVGVKFKDGGTSKSATDFKKIFNEVVEMPQQQGIQFEEFKPVSYVSMPQSSTSSSLIAPSPEKKRKHIETTFEDQTGNDDNLDAIGRQQKQEIDAEEVPDQQHISSHESPSKKKKQNTSSPSIDTRFDHILNGLPTQESQHSIIASQPVLLHSLLQPSHHSQHSVSSTSENGSQRSLKSSRSSSSGGGSGSGVIQPSSHTIRVEHRSSSQEALSPVLFAGVAVKFQQQTHPSQTIIESTPPSQEESQKESQYHQSEAAPQQIVSSFASSTTLSSHNNRNNPSQNHTANSSTTENNVTGIIGDDHNNNNTNHTTCGASPLSSTTPKGLYFFVDEDETNSHYPNSTLHDIFFTPYKSKLSSASSEQYQLASPPLISDVSIEEIISSTDNMQQQEVVEERPKSPHSLSQHNKPPVVEVVYLSDDDGVEILEHATPQKSKKSQACTGQSSTISSPTSLTSRSPNTTLLTDEETPRSMKSINSTPLFTTPPLANLTLSTPPQPSSTSSTATTTSSNTATKTPKKVSLKFLLDNNDMSDL